MSNELLSKYSKIRSEWAIKSLLKRNHRYSKREVEHACEDLDTCLWCRK